MLDSVWTMPVHTGRAFFALITMASLLLSPAVLGEESGEESSAGSRNVGLVPSLDKFAAHLAAGEFGPARQLANQSPAARDGMLRQLAAAQARAGARGASWSTAADIRNDSQRSSAYGELATHPMFSGHARGGAALADFDSLIELMKSTIAPDSWDDAGGSGAAESFRGGVLVDATGTMKRIRPADMEPALASLRREALSAGGNRDVRTTSRLRKVSLTRLERRAEWLAAQGKHPDPAMVVLAGLTKVKYVFVYPETRDIVLAGPAGDWTIDPEGRSVNIESHQPTLRLDDLVVVMRNAMTAGGVFGCSITPRADNLATLQGFLADSAKKPLRPGDRTKWFDDLRARLGSQDITVDGVDPRTHTARVLVEADYRMKLVGMGLEPGVLGVQSYLDSIEVSPAAPTPPMDVLRWWFTLGEDCLKSTETGDAFELVGSAVKVLSENELLSERGARIHTGDSHHLNQLFTQRFTKHFEQLAVKYPIYAELRNVFELALVGALIREQDLAGRCDWEQSHFGPRGAYQVEFGVAPRQVASVVNHREIDRQHFVVGVSGGVSVNTSSTVRAGIKTDTYGLIKAEHGGARPPQLPNTAWWWD